MRRLAIAAALITLAVGPALAQAPPAGTPTRIRGTVDKLDGQTLMVKSREGPVLTIALAPNFTVLGVVKKRLSDIKAGRRPVRAPVYSHLLYDVMPNQWIEIDRPDLLIVEGLNVLQTGRPPRDGKAIPYVSDFFDFSVYLDADENVLRGWYVDRFLTLRGTAFADPKSYFHRYSTLSNQEAVATATAIWNRINLVNLYESILPTRQRADLILTKGENHLVCEVALRRL